MAINDVRLFGQLTQKPTYFVRKGASAPHKVMLTVKTLSRYYNSQDRDRIMFDEVVVMTQSPDMIQYIHSNLKENDVIYIKGMLCTAEVKRNFICGGCEAPFQENGVSCYVHPINIYLCQSNLSDKEGNKLIQQNAEVSDEVIMDGVICTDVRYMPEKRYAYYKLAVKRSYHILEDPPERRIDFPVINSYFEQAETDSKCLHKGSRINVKGAIRVRSITRKVQCPFCGTDAEAQYKVLEVVASNISYTANWEAPESEGATTLEIEQNVDNIETMQEQEVQQETEE